MTQLDYVLWAALAIGAAFGLCGQATGFCLQRGLTQLWSKQSAVKLRSFAMALAVALLGTQLSQHYGLLDLSQSIYRVSTLSWMLLPVGGILFGIGMSLCNGCGARALVLLGQGNLRSLFVLLCIGIAGLATLTGFLAPVRVYLSGLTSVNLAASHPSGATQTAILSLLCLALLSYALHHYKRDRHTRDLVGGMLIGLLVVAGWLSTGYLGADDFDPVPLVSLTFVAPVGDTIQYAMIATGMSLRFGIVVVIGVVLGALLSAIWRREWHWEGFQSVAQMRRYLLGGLCMGVGGALASGCSIGQGLTGLSTLAYSSMIALAGIVIGSGLAYRYLPLKA